MKAIIQQLEREVDATYMRIQQLDKEVSKWQKIADQIETANSDLQKQRDELEFRLEEAIEVAQRAERAYNELKIERDALRYEMDVITGKRIVEGRDPREILLSTYRLYVARGDEEALDLMERAADMPGTQEIHEEMRRIRLGVTIDDLPF